MSDRTYWTDQELDDALASLHADIGTSPRSAAAARVAMLAAIAEPAAGPAEHEELVPIRPRGRRFGGPTRWVAAAAVVTVLVGGGLAVQAAGSGTPGASAQAVALLNRSADMISIGDDVPVGPGQYRVVRTHAWNSMSATAVDGSEHRYLFEEVATRWVPFDPADEWQLTSTHTGNLRWITDEAAGRAAGVDVWRGRIGQPEGTTGPATEVLRAPRGEFYGPPSGYDSWPATPEFIAALPRDPDTLYALMIERLGEYGPSNRWGDGATLLGFPADLLRTGLVPADLRAAFYEVMARIPGIRVTDGQADLDGRVGVAFAVTDDEFRITDDVGLTQEIIVDPATGDFLGERFTSADGSPRGSTAVTVGVADELGAEPAG